MHMVKDVCIESCGRGINERHGLSYQVPGTEGAAMGLWEESGQVSGVSWVSEGLGHQ